jgi:hypothetical protein
MENRNPSLKNSDRHHQDVKGTEKETKNTEKSEEEG